MGPVLPINSLADHWMCVCVYLCASCVRVCACTCRGEREEERERPRDKTRLHLEQHPSNQASLTVTLQPCHQVGHSLME